MKRKIDDRIVPGIDKRYAQICQVFFNGDVHKFADQCGLNVCTVEALFDPRDTATDHPTFNRRLQKIIPELSMRWLWFNEGSMLNKI